MMQIRCPADPGPNKRLNQRTNMLATPCPTAVQ